MLKNLIRAFLICRLELRQPSLDLDLAFLSWLYRPAIQILLEEKEDRGQQREHLLLKLDEVYPF
jgi:hypothetical protein